MESYQSLLTKQQAFFRTNKTKDISFRIDALTKLRTLIQAHEADIMHAVHKDLNKSAFEAYTSEIGILLEEIKFTIKNIKKWSKPKRVKTAITHVGTKSYIQPEPYGSALIIAPWNYPFQLAIAPLIGAIAAGNCAVIKPSELTPNVSALLARMLNTAFQEEFIAVTEGGVETSEALLAENFDYIFFTGSVSVGRIVMEAAAKHLTPLTLELGGKSPGIVHEDAHIRLAAKRIAWGKYLNAGQTCVAPDYLYVHENVIDIFLESFQAAITELYESDPLRNTDYTRIVSERHFERLHAFLTNGKISIGGKSDKTRLTIEPTVLTDITWNDPIMGDEIFGPILPIMTYSDLNEVINGIHQFPNPLALYLFTESSSVEQQILGSVSFGGGCINDTVYHLATPYLPFGGVGTSGMGAYHGKGSFDVFSHHKSILKQTTRFDIPFRYPNMKDGLKRIKKLMG